MDLIADDYGTEITSQSQTELEKLTTWQKENHGEWSTIIGGWAVWSYYTDSFGSRDIDIILPEDATKQMDIIQNYFPKNGITEHNKDPFGAEQFYSKTIHAGKRTDEIIFDLFYPNNPRPDNEELGVTVDWRWVFHNYKEQPIGENSYILVPDPELLLPLKMVAALSRVEEMRLKGDNRSRRSKIWKDYHDVAIITKHVRLDERQLLSHMKKIGITEMLRKSFLDGYIARTDIPDMAKIAIQEITRQIPKPK